MELDYDILVQTVQRFESEGYMFYPDWTMDLPRTPERVGLPSGKIFGLDELIFRGCLEAQKGLDYYNIIKELGTNFWVGYSSFRDSADVEDCKEKYKSYFLFF